MKAITAGAMVFCLLLSGCEKQAAVGNASRDEIPEVTLPGQSAQGYVLFEGHFVEITYVNHDGLAVFGGDMIVGRHDDIQRMTIAIRKVLKNSRKPVRLTPDNPKIAAAIASVKGRAEVSKRWPSRTIPYKIESSITDATLISDITLAIADWNATGLVNFVPDTEVPSSILRRTNTVIFKDAPGDAFTCLANVGHQPKRDDQWVVLNPSWKGAADGTGEHRGCDRGNVLHEIGHVLGLEHEHQRGDRLRYIKAAEGGFDGDRNLGIKPDQREMTMSYDPCSIMHYQMREEWFALTESGQIAYNACKRLLPVQGEQCTRIGQRCQLSPADAEAVRQLMSSAVN